jgi:hypothetical protein
LLARMRRVQWGAWAARCFHKYVHRVAAFD